MVEGVRVIKVPINLAEQVEVRVLSDVEEVPTTHSAYKQQSKKHISIVFTNTLVCPHAVVVHQWDAPVADAAMMRVLKLCSGTLLALNCIITF